MMLMLLPKEDPNGLQRFLLPAIDEPMRRDLRCPMQQDLNDLMATTDRVRILRWARDSVIDSVAQLMELLKKDCPPTSREVISVAEVTSREALIELAECLHIDEGPQTFGYYSASDGEPLLEFGPSGTIITVVLCESLRWDSTWEGEANLVTGTKLKSWLVKHGFPGSLVVKRPECAASDSA